MATTITTEPWVIDVEDEFDAALRAWARDAELDQFIKMQRTVDAAVLDGLDLDAAIERAAG